MSVEPMRQASRSRRNCKCGGPCFYCDRPLYTRHEHDHFPMPARFGGEMTVPACLDCHDLKDRIPVARWPPESFREFVRGGLSTPEARIWFAAMSNLLIDIQSENDELKADAA